MVRSTALVAIASVPLASCMRVTVDEEYESTVHFRADAPSSSCSVGDHVTCPGSTDRCAGSQCCPDGSTCPSGAGTWTPGCSYAKTVDCTMDGEHSRHRMGMGGMGMGMGRMGRRRMGMGMGGVGDVVGSSINSDVWEALYDVGTPMSDEQMAPTYQQFGSTLQDLDVNALAADIRSVMFNNRYFWPADFGGVKEGVFSGDGGSSGENGNYGPLFVRLAWHCSGTYRISDGKGGCTGGRQRFEPERSWDDNTNLDKARALLAPIKIKYGDALSWGDLIIAAGTTALREMGTPVRQFCLGRVDEPDGTDSLPLGIGGRPESSIPPCEVQGMCEEPLGAGTVGLIYVNPEGPVVEAGGSPVPDPALSAANIRDVFGRMGQDDRETVALIGGGHSVGKSHGACDIPGAQGLIPSEAYEQDQRFAWDGECGRGSGHRGKGPNVVTSGIEGAWTTRPTYWDNEFFTKLLDREWELFTGPGGKYQWRIVNANAEEEKLMRMTTDIALINDDKYRALVEEFAHDQTAFDEAFDDAWFKLTHRGGSWSPESKCDVGSMPAWVTEAGNNRMLDSDY